MARQFTLMCLIGLAAPALAETVNENGYEVTRSQTLVPVPHGKVGRKTIDRETRIGNSEETDGNSAKFTMTLGGFMNRCPMPEGDAPVKFVVPGDFEYSVVMDTVNTDVVPTERKRYEKHMTARIKVFVNDDLSVTEGEIEGEFSSNMDGVRTGPVRLPPMRFPIREHAMPDFDALIKVVTVTGDMAAAALMWNSSTTILAAQKGWSEPNACAEFEFDPPSETRAVASGEAVEIRVKYRTRDGQQPIPKGIWDAKVEQGGRLTEATGQVKPEGSFTVRYVGRTSGEPKEGDGASFQTRSGAGYARDTWKIRVGGDYELHFTSVIVSRDPVQSARSQAVGTVRLTGSTKPSRLKRDGKLYRLYDGTGTVTFQTAPGPERDACDPLISGSGTSQIKVEEAWIQVTPPQDAGGKQIAGKADIQMPYSISMGAGETEMTPTMVNYKCVPGESWPIPFWWSAFLSAREPTNEVNLLRDWEYVGKDGVIARKTLRGNCAGLCDEELSTFTLKQAPAAGKQQGGGPE